MITYKESNTNLISSYLDLYRRRFHNYNKNIAVVIPSFKVRAHILQIIKAIGPEVDVIYVIDDCCPEKVKGLKKLNIRKKNSFIYIYGDSKGDCDMLFIVNIQAYRAFH